ncbi:MAG: TadE/TadG family type IV pilus assembly protein [Sphingomonas sp.]
MTRRLFKRLATDEHASTLLEFAFVAPILTLLLVGGFEIGHTLYMRAVLQGIVQKIARDGTLETNGTTTASTTLDARVRDQVRFLYSGVNTQNLTFSRRFYRTFSQAAAAQEERYTDTNGNGTCDNNEPYQDDNNNNTWDRDGGDSGQGGAKDKTLYTVSLTYPRLTPIAGFIGVDRNATVRASTVLANQPYNDQNSYGAPTARNCP